MQTQNFLILSQNIINSPINETKSNSEISENLSKESEENENNETGSFEFSLDLSNDGDEDSETNKTSKRILKFSPNEVILVCNGPHTRKGSNGLCECVEGFEYGDPFSKYGCYHCNHKCHDDAICSYPGKCVCKNGMIGDGIKTCDIPLPIVTSMSPTLARSVGGETIIVHYYTESNYTQKYGYCKYSIFRILSLKFNFLGWKISLIIISNANYLIL